MSCTASSFNRITPSLTALAQWEEWEGILYDICVVTFSVPMTVRAPTERVCSDTFFTICGVSMLQNAVSGITYAFLTKKKFIMHDFMFTQELRVCVGGGCRCVGGRVGVLVGVCGWVTVRVYVGVKRSSCVNSGGSSTSKQAALCERVRT